MQPWLLWSPVCHLGWLRSSCFCVLSTKTEGMHSHMKLDLFFFFFFILCACFACVNICACTQCPQKPAEDVKIPRYGGIGIAVESRHIGAGTKPSQLSYVQLPSTVGWPSYVTHLSGYSLTYMAPGKSDLSSSIRCPSHLPLGYGVDNKN